METVLEKVSKKTAPADRLPGVEYDENGRPVGKTVVEILDKLDRKFIDFYGEEGRRMVNAHREEWNRTGPWHFDLL